MNRIASALRGRSELGVAALLGALALVVGGNALSLRDTGLNVGVLGPQVVPLVVAGGLAVCAVLLAIDVLRGGRGEPESGEDIDLNRRTDWRTLGGLALTIIAFALLIPMLGYPIASALLFYASALLLGSRRFIIAAVVAVALSLLTFYGFVLGLGIPLPAGVLTGIL